MKAYRRKAKQVRRLAGLALAFLLGTTSLASTAPRKIKVNNETVGEVQVLAPQSQPSLFPMMISDQDGWTVERRTEAEQLVAKGAAVAMIDLPTYLAKLAASDYTDCHSAFGNFEDIARTAERELGMTNWCAAGAVRHRQARHAGLSRPRTGARQTTAALSASGSMTGFNPSWTFAKARQGRRGQWRIDLRAAEAASRVLDLDCGTINGGGARGIQIGRPGTIVKTVTGAPTRTVSRQACEICRGPA